METILLPAAVSLLFKLNLPTPRPGAKLAPDLVERALLSVPPSRRAHALADLKFHGWISP
jgi:hypothetical protein